MFFCTASDRAYFSRLENLIGSIHRQHYAELEEIAVFDLGLTPKQKKQVRNMKKVRLCQVEMVHPDILKPLQTNKKESFNLVTAFSHTSQTGAL